MPEIFINGKPASITLEDEKTTGDVLAGLDGWLAGTGSRLSGLEIDGDIIGSESIEEAMNLDLSNIKSMNMLVSSWSELALGALFELASICELYRNASFNERPEIISEYEKGPAASFLEFEIPDLAGFAKQCFSGEINADDLNILVEERIREFDDPEGEISAVNDLVLGVCSRMEELPLDMQTGKDSRAAETMQIFSRVSEKLFRITGILKMSGFSFDDFAVDGAALETFNSEFGTVLEELVSAYKNNDTVLAGDMAEYEISPRLLKFYLALKEKLSLTVTGGGN